MEFVTFPHKDIWRVGLKGLSSVIDQLSRPHHGVIGVVSIDSWIGLEVSKGQQGLITPQQRHFFYVMFVYGTHPGGAQTRPQSLARQCWVITVKKVVASTSFGSRRVVSLTTSAFFHTCRYI